MRNFTVVENKTSWPTDELTPLLNLAWDTVAKGPIRAIRSKIRIAHTRRSTYHTSFLEDGVIRIAVRPPGQTAAVNVGRTVRCADTNELLVYLFAWTFAGVLSPRQYIAARASEALTEYRKRAAQIVERQVAIVAMREQRDGAKLAKAVFDEMRLNSYDYKLSRLEAMEANWKRKAKLAATKLRTLRRRKSALQAAQTRKQRQPEIVTA